MTPLTLQAHLQAGREIVSPILQQSPLRIELSVTEITHQVSAAWVSAEKLKIEIRDRDRETERRERERERDRQTDRQTDRQSIREAITAETQSTKRAQVYWQANLSNENATKCQCFLSCLTDNQNETPFRFEYFRLVHGVPRLYPGLLKTQTLRAGLA